MRSRWYFTWAVICLTTVPLMGSAQEKPPTVVVRFRSLETLIQQTKLVASMAGKSEEAKQFEGLIKSRVGAKGLSGIDLDRPFGGYVRVGAGLNDASGALMVPIADEKAFLDLLKGFNLRMSKDAGGVYTVKADVPFDIYFRFANKYAYATIIAIDSVHDKNLIAPGKIFPPMMKKTMSATIRIDQIPEQAKQLSLVSLEGQLAKQAGKQGLQQEFAKKVQQEILTKFKRFLDEAEAWNIGLEIDSSSKQMSFSSSLTAKGGELAKAIDKLGNAKTLFSGLLSDSAAVNGLVHMTLPASVQKTVEQAFTEVRNKALDDIDDAAKRKKAKQLFQALEPTAKAGEIDAAVTMFRPEGSNRFGLVLAMKVRDGKELGELVRKLAQELLKEAPEEERKRVKIDAFTVDGVKVHRLDVQDKFDPKTRKIFGDNPVYVAFREDALFFATGDGAAKKLKSAVGSDTTGKGPIFQFRVSFARLGAVMAENETQRQIVQKYVNSGKKGTVRISVNADEALNMVVTADLSLVKLFAELDKAKE